MATVTEHKRRKEIGGDITVYGTIAFGTANSSGGEVITIPNVEHIRDLQVNGGGYVWEWTRSTQTLVAKVPNGATTGDVPLTAVASGTSLAAVTAAPFTAICSG